MTTLRRAAALMRERAEGAMSGPWRNDFGRVSADVPGYGPALVVEPVRKGDAEHIASWHPAVALAVADWLDFVAAGREAFDGLERARLRVVLNGTSTTTPPVAPKPSELFADTERHALAVTRSYLGESA